MNRILLSSLTVIAGFALATTIAGAQQRQPSPQGEQRLTREVRHELVMLPYYGVFDNLSYRINGYDVELMGQVTRPTLKTDAERAVKRIEGVERVINNIEVLPLSPHHDRIH